MAGRGEETGAGEVWDDLDKRFRAPLRSYFARRLNGWTDAEDLTQEVFVRLTRNPDRNNGENIEAYVFKIASTVLKDWLRYKTSRQAQSHRALADTTDNPETPLVLIEERNPERVLIGKETLRDLEDALSQLNPRTREIFLLSRIENVHHRDIASLHGISISAVEKHVLKAIARLAARAFKP
jgi:RNA polymerase sigma-70 factor (ECF subfamily)